LNFDWKPSCFQKKTNYAIFQSASGRKQNPGIGNCHPFQGLPETKSNEFSADYGLCKRLKELFSKIMAPLRGDIMIMFDTAYFDLPMESV